MQEELTLTGVTRTFAGRRALDDVSFTVRPGRTTALIGPEGAGKTTAMRVIMGVLTADAGTVALAGRPLGPGDRRVFGYLPEERGLYPRMTVHDQLVFLARVHGVRSRLARRRVDALLDRLDLESRAGDALDTLPPAEQLRVQVASALVHDPAVLVLDEPLSGLDRATADVAAELLRERADAGVPVLLSADRPDLVEQWCDDVVVLEQGRVAAAGDVQVLAARSPRRLALTVETVARAEPDDGRAALLADVLGVPGVVLHDRQGDRLVLELAPDADDQEVLTAALRHGRVRELAPVRPSFGEILTGRGR